MPCVGRMNFARVMLTFFAASQGNATLAIDFNRTHATNPRWPGHARFHLVWHNITVALFAAIAVALIWWREPYPDERFYLAAFLTFIPMLGFLAALVSRKLYGGTLHDDNGIPPLRLPFRGKLLELDGNAIAVALGCTFLAVTVLIYR